MRRGFKPVICAPAFARARGAAALAVAGALGAATLVAQLALAPPAAARVNRPWPPTYHYAVPVQPTSPWPTMRRDLRNTGSSPIVGRYRGDGPWRFRTGKGIFSTPIVGGDGTTYFGSADTYFYAVSPRGKLEWRFKTGNLIDSAGFIGAWNRRLRTYPVVVPSGDTNLYELRTNGRRMARARRIIWKYRPPSGLRVAGQLVDWWEGNAEPGPDGTIYAGNTGDAAFALHPDGTLKWVYRSFGSFWTDPAIGPDGTTYWGSLDLQVHALSPAGSSRWSKLTLGFVISSPALDETGTLYVGSFDSKLYAIDAADGTVKWTFPTSGDIYSSPALEENAAGMLEAIIFASTDGNVYAVDPQGRLLWTYDTGDVVRSSPVIGFAPDGVHRVVYVGAGNGVLYALNAADGTRRWSFDTTLANPALHDRNDLNGSPALTNTGVVIGGEDGYLNYVPYDYCLHRSDRRCNTDSASVFAPNLTAVYPVTVGGSTEVGGRPQSLGAAAVIPTRLVVRRGGRTLDASVLSTGDASGLITTSPRFPFTAQVSGDGHNVFVVPDGFLTPGTDYSVRIKGLYTANGIPVGGARVGGTAGGSFDQTLRYHVGPALGPLPLHSGANQVSAFKLTRLALPLPPFLTSVNQIGFDSYDLIVGALNVSPPDADGAGSLLLWAIGARPGPDGVQQVDPQTRLAFALAGRYHDDSIAVSAQNATLTFSFGPVPVGQLDLRAQLSRTLTAMPGASIYAVANCLAIPTYGPLLPTQRLCNDSLQLPASGTFLTQAYPAAGHANRRPAGVAVASLTLQRPSLLSPGAAVAKLALAPGASYPASDHAVSIVLVNAATGAPVGLDYRADTATTTDAAGNISSVRLTLPTGTAVPPSVRAYVVADVFPLAVDTFPP